MKLTLQAEILEMKKEIAREKLRGDVLEQENIGLKQSESDIRLYCTQKVGEMSGQLMSASSIIAMASMQHPGMVPPFDYVESPLPVELGFQGSKKRKSYGGEAEPPRQLLGAMAADIG